MSPYDALPASPDADAFRALARSSPWRFRTLHVTHRRSGQNPVEAWLTRPGHLEVRTSDGGVESVSGLPYSKAYLSVGPGAAPEWRPLTPQDCDAPEPRRRADGLVAERPEGVDYDDPMWQDFRWVAMLDPVELSHGVDVSEVTADLLRARRTWFAECRALEGYDPRCSCCALLHGEVSQRLEQEAGGRDLDEIGRAVLPTAYLVGLDVETGVVASLTALDGDAWRLGFENVIHATP